MLHPTVNKGVMISYAADDCNCPNSDLKSQLSKWPLNLKLFPSIGPLDDEVTTQDVTGQLSQYGVIKGISKISAKESAIKRCLALVDFKDSISVRRVFSNKIFIKGKHVRITLSRLALELVLSKTVVFFYEAHETCDKKSLENHFSQYGQLFRTFHIMEEDFQTPKPYGFVDFVGGESVQQAILNKQQLVSCMRVLSARGCL